jgi:hypothetical protein
MEVHDYWFTLDFKLIWKKAPQASAAGAAATPAAAVTPAAPSSEPAPRSAPAPRPARKSSKRSGGDFGD